MSYYLSLLCVYNIVSSAYEMSKTCIIEKGYFRVNAHAHIQHPSTIAGDE